ncbi:DMT family transporter [Amycolatopsis sp. H6(2020)]|nr:DMT family transporter [Amycolatopsis sp. H6(2020)]
MTEEADGYRKGVGALAAASLFIGGTNVVFGHVGVFVLLYTGLEYLEPAIASALQAGATPVFTLIVLAVLDRRRGVRTAEVAGAAAILLGSTALAWISFSGRSGLATSNTREIVLGIAAVVGSGLATVFLTLCARKLTRLGWSNVQILAHRCYLTVIGGGLLGLRTGQDWSAVTGSAGIVALFSVLGITIPLLLLQTGIRNAPPFVVLAMTNLNPILTYLLQPFDHRLATSPYTLAGIVIVFAGVLWIIWSQARQARREPARLP